MGERQPLFIGLGLASAVMVFLMITDRRFTFINFLIFAGSFLVVWGILTLETGGNDRRW